MAIYEKVVDKSFIIIFVIWRLEMYQAGGYFLSIFTLWLWKFKSVVVSKIHLKIDVLNGESYVSWCIWLGKKLLRFFKIIKRAGQRKYVENY